MMRAFILLLAGTLWLSIHVYGQEKPPETTKKASKEFKDYKWDVNIGLHGWVGAFSNLMIRYSPKQKGAFRFSLENHDSRKTKDWFLTDTLGNPIDRPVVKDESFNVVAIVGYEFRRNSGKQQIFYGVDLQPSINNYTDHKQTSYPLRIYGLGLNPFIGLKYRILNRLSVSAETSFSVKLEASRAHDLNDNFVRWKSKNIYTSFNPLKVINISYHL
ncbi:hypothetical protein [Dyadobacter chenhuakuii]|uniref:Uncharacterized protein n=1 Tax=Dyadobacter chenhuakuii TaxID=2909339 RepID=A0A9X1QG73_9BACT|nr:hypothetical protein [Dyadobacter chenhuakuii]MCF2500896.1 hypothetical protein [Dyadobacter chenhuakuii]